MYVCLYVCLPVCLYVCMFPIHIHIHLHIHVIHRIALSIYTCICIYIYVTPHPQTFLGSTLCRSAVPQAAGWQGCVFCMPLQSFEVDYRFGFCFCCMDLHKASDLISACRWKFPFKGGLLELRLQRSSFPDCI